MPKYWLGVVSRDHVKIGESGGFCQVCHGKGAPLNKMKAGDFIVYYSSKKSLGDKKPYQKFTAIAEILDGEAYQFAMSKDFIPYRKDVKYLESVAELDYAAVKDHPEWIAVRSRLRFGHFEISKVLFEFIRQQMVLARTCQ